MKKFLNLLVFIIIAETAGIIGSVFTFSAIPNWYAGLTKPWFNPPGYLFGPVWTALYALMGIAAYLVWEKRSEKRQVKTALYFFAAQLALNSLWSIIFFGLKNPGLAFLEIVILWILIAKTMALFFKISKPAGYLLIPYLAWVTFASVLNLSIALLN